MSETGKHQGVIAYAAAYSYAEVEDILKIAKEKNDFVNINIPLMPLILLLFDIRTYSHF